VAYRADIEIGVVGASRLKELQERITKLSRAIDDANVKTLIDRNAVQSINSYSEAVGRASRNLRETAIQLDAAGKASGDYAQAISQVVTALGQENAAKKIQNDLISDEIELRRRAKLAASGIRETTQYGGPIGPGPASPVGTLAGQRSPVEERIKRTIQGRRDETDLQQALLRLEEKSAAELNKKVQAQDALVKGTQEVLELLAAQAQKSKFLAGTSGPLAQGPLAGAGAMGFPVALPLTKIEQKSLEINAKKQEILNRMATTRQQLAGLASNLQRLDQNSAVAIADANRNQKQLNRSKQEAIELAERELNISRQGTLLAGKFSPVGGAANIPGSPLFLQAQRERRASQLSGIALGGGFPLLFGGGPGAVLGGAAGGLVPGPNAFAAQIGLSAIGQQADLFVAAAAKTGVALTSTGKTLEFMREKALFSTTAVEDQAIALGEQGRVSELADLLTQDLARSIGGEGVKALQELGDETNQLTKEWNTLTAQLFALVAGPLKAFIAALNTVLGGITAENRLATLRREATPAQQARLAEITRAQRGGTFRNVPGGKRQFIAGPEDAQAILSSAAAEGIVPSAPAGRVTSEDRRTFTPPKPKADKAARDAAREAQRVLEVLRDQKLITIELERQSDYSKKIFAAELAKDPILARRLQGEQQLEEIAIETAGKLEKEVNMKAKLAILGTQEAKAALAYQKTVQDIALIEQQRKENAENTIRGFQQELALKNATTEAERNRLRIMYEMDALRQGKQFDEGQLAQIEALKKQIAAPQSAAEIVQQRIGALQDEITKLTNLGTVAVSVADSIGTAFGQAFQGIISGSMTTQEALAGFFKSVGDAFLQMASEIIAKQITMIILQTILKALGAVAGGGGSYSSGNVSTNAFTPTMATGGFGSTNSVSGASLGSFSGGTFGVGAMANGGSVRAATPYLVGERGPELFVPGTNGGVMSNSDLRSSMGAAPGSAGGSPVLNMSFETTNIGGVDYVSRDQLEAAMAETRRQATRDGARRGMTMTLDRIQQSPQTRTRIGLR